MTTKKNRIRRHWNAETWWLLNGEKKIAVQSINRFNTIIIGQVSVRLWNHSWIVLHLCHVFIRQQSLSSLMSHARCRYAESRSQLEFLSGSHVLAWLRRMSMKRDRQGHTRATCCCNYVAMHSCDYTHVWFLIAATYRPIEPKWTACAKERRCVHFRKLMEN